MATLIAIPILGLLLILQSAIVSRIVLIQGSADLVLLALVAWAVQERVRTAWQWSIVGGLLVSVVSAVPFLVILAGYLLTTFIAVLLRQRIWGVRILGMFTATFIGTLITHALTIAALQLSGTPISWDTALNTITLPSALLNLILVVPMYALIGDLANWIYPDEIEI